MAKAWAAAGIVLALVLCGVTKPVHLDDPGFLRLAEGAARDPWRPHDVEINWLGTTQRAFDVLANPPGLGYWLAPVRHAPEWALHLWMLPWLALALYGTARAAQAFGVPAARAILVLGTSPVFVLSAQSLMPDLPLLACALAGLAGFLTSERRAGAWALLAGASALFKYSGLCLVPLLLLAGAQRGRLRESLWVVTAPALLFLHDLHAYGQVHALTMTGFQASTLAADRMFEKLVAALASFGGACLLPVLPWRRAALPFAAAGGLLGLAAGWQTGESVPQLAATAVAAAAGGLALGVFALRSAQDRFLAVWFALGAAFLLALLFVATRYWLPFVPAAVLAALRGGPSRARVVAAVAVAAALSFALARDDERLARGYRDAAREVSGRFPPGVFAGHWGWQYYLERAGWRPLESGEPVSGRLAIAFAPWPQSGDTAACSVREYGKELDGGWPIRVYSAEGAASFHSNLIAGREPIASFAPWTLSTAPRDRIAVWRCDAP